MGLTFIEDMVTGPTGKQVRVNFLMDGGATYTLLPDMVWHELELQPKRQMTFTPADGTTVSRPIPGSAAHIALAGQDGTSPVVLDEPGDEALFGAVILEVLGLVLDPFKRSLQPMRAMLV